MQPLIISKVNTGLQLLLAGACVTHHALDGWPPVVLVDLLSGATAVTTSASLAAYALQAHRRLALEDATRSQRNDT